jgi:hypothetical protein
VKHRAHCGERLAPILPHTKPDLAWRQALDGGDSQPVRDSLLIRLAVLRIVGGLVDFVFISCVIGGQHVFGRIHL